MINRPRPRKLINVIKTSNSTEEIEIPTEIEFEKEKQKASILISNEVPFTPNNLKAKPVIVSTIPSVPQFNSVQLNSKIKINDNDNELKKNTIEKSILSSSTLTNKPSNAVNSIKKTTIPPPPNYFSNSQASSSSSTSQSSPVLSEKSSGEAFLDAADRAADFIGGAFLV